MTAGGIGEVLAALAATLSQAAATSPVTNTNSAAQGGFAADQTSQLSCESFLSPELAEGGSEADGECRSYDPVDPGPAGGTAPVTGDRPQPVPAPSPPTQTFNKVPLPTDFDGRPEATPTRAHETDSAIDAVKDALDDRATIEILPYTTLVLPSWGDLLISSLGPPSPYAMFPSVVFDTERATEDVLELTPGDRPEMPLSFDEEAPVSVVDRAREVVEQVIGADQIVKRATNLLKAAAMNPDDLTDAQAAEQERIKARDGFLLAWELLWLALNNRSGKGKQQASPSGFRPLPPASTTAPAPKVDLIPSRAQQMRNRIEGTAQKQNRSADDPSIHRLGSAGGSSALGKGDQGTVTGLFDTDHLQSEGDVTRKVTKGARIEVKAGSKNNNGVQEMKIVIDDVSKTSKGNRREHEDWRRAFREAGLIDEGYDAGHGIGRAIADVLTHFNFFNEPPAGNRGAKNMGAERRVREWLEATDRGVPARLEYRAQFRDADGNPVVEKCRITLIGEDGTTLVNIAIDLVANSAVVIPN